MEDAANCLLKEVYSLQSHKYTIADMFLEAFVTDFATVNICTTALHMLSQICFSAEL